MEFKELNPESLERAAGMLKAIAHPVRITIVGCLEDGKKRTVTEIHKQLGIEQATASHHLGILKRQRSIGLKKGREKYVVLSETRKPENNPRLCKWLLPG
jgi:DNA-binding transcriptional ArsR family regulator